MFPLDAPDLPEPKTELLVALGRVVFEFGLLDKALHDALWYATGQREDTRIFTSGLRFPQLVDRFEGIYASYRGPNSANAGVSEFCAYLNTLNADRNRDVHAVWGFLAESGRPARTQHRLKRGSMSLKIDTVELSTLESLALRMRGAAETIWEIALTFERQSATIRQLSSS